jgi:hypothetical protein
LQAQVPKINSTAITKKKFQQQIRWSNEIETLLEGQKHQLNGLQKKEKSECNNKNLRLNK